MAANSNSGRKGTIRRVTVPAGKAGEFLVFRNAAAWETWLTQHHAEANGAWLLIAKKGSPAASITIDEALEVALCFGWIDSQRKGYDAQSYLQRYSRRTATSPWSKLNVQRAEALLKTLRVQKAGLAEIAAAKADGRWAAAYESQRTVALPADLANALKRNHRARKAFERLDKTGRYAVFLPILKATTSKVRDARVQKALSVLEKRAVT